MRYAKPRVLTTVPANVAIQNGSDGHQPKSRSTPDNLTNPLIQSTTGAYQADE